MTETSFQKWLWMLCAAAAVAFTACGPQRAQVDESYEDFGESTDELNVVTDDDLNGLYLAKVNGVSVTDGAVVESWPAVGIRLTFQGQTYALTRNADALTGNGVALTVKPNNYGITDDTLEGTVGTNAVIFKRDSYVKAPIVLQFPKDRPFRSFLNEVIAPAAQRDRESFVTLRVSKTGPWLRDCELYRSGSWLFKYFKGANWTEKAQSFQNVLNAVNYVKTNPRRMTKEKKFQDALKANLADPTNTMGLAMSTFSMYFTTAGGRSLRMPLTSTSTAYFITDRPLRAEKIGLVVMDTPTHHPLASTFGRQLLDLGAMPSTDDALYVRAMMDLLAKSDNTRAAQLSGVGQSALTDWYAVMAIEDYRGVAFGYPWLGWGYNMTNVQFYGLVTRALNGQVLVGSELRPGDASYADVLNNGNDMQEYQDMASLKQRATQYLQAYHPELINEVKAAFSGIVPSYELDWRAQADIFHFVTAQLYDPQNRTVALMAPGRADRAVNAVAALFDTLHAESAQFEAYLLSQGITRSSVPAPKSTGY